MSLQAIKYEDGCLEILDQLLLPIQTKFIPIRNVEDGWNAIKKMQVRGAPAIALVGCLSLAVEINKIDFETKYDILAFFRTKMSYLITARPTAVNIKRAADDLARLCNNLSENTNIDVKSMKIMLLDAIRKMLEDDIADNKAIGFFGATLIQEKSTNQRIRVLTHCNTGSLATAGYGTALGVIRRLHELQILDQVYCTETRPYNQGARLTAYELVYEKIPAILITDSMVAILMKTKKISAVIVGADRVAANGDTANKIGTYQIAVLAKYHNIDFYIAAPLTSIDLDVPNGDHITIEERPPDEMTHIGEYQIAAPGINCWNPAFDITPGHLITAIITEKGVFSPDNLEKEVRNIRLDIDLLNRN